MIIQSNRIGTVDVDETRIIAFDDGLLGFPLLKRWFLADDPNDENMPFKWLVSVENPEFMFLVTDPGIFFKDFVFDLSEEDQKFLNVKSQDDVTVISILTVPADPKEITANLKGPLVINWKTFRGRQIVLKDPVYETKHFIFLQATADQNASTTQFKGVQTRDIPLSPADMKPTSPNVAEAKG